MTYRTMKRLNPKRMAKKNRYYYWDIESWGLNPQNTAFIIVKPERQYTKSMPEEWLFKTGGEMRAWMDDLPTGFKHIFYAHNSHKFDTLALYSAEEIAKSTKVAAGGTLYSLQPEKHLELRDSVQLLCARLAAYGAKGVTPQKFIDENDPDFGNLDSITDQDIDYCRQDVDILREAVTTLRSAYRDWTGHQGADLPLTAASMAYRTWCARSWPEAWSWESKSGTRYSVTFPDEANDAARKAYYGGRVEVFPGFDGIEVEGVMSYDRNSMFPAEMLNQTFPDPNRVRRANPSCGRVTRLRARGQPYWGRFRLRAGPDASLFLPTIIDGKADYRQREYDGFLMFPEVNHALDNGWTLVGVDELWMSEPINHFSAYVSHFYDLRLRLKADGDNRQAFVKILLNSLYGKFGSRDRTERVEDTNGINSILEEPDWRERYEVKFWNDDEAFFYLLSKEATERPNCTFFPWAASITSYARVSLQSTIAACERAGFGVVYCDTDSVHLHGLKPGDDVPVDIGHALGQWDLERPSGAEHLDAVPRAVYWERKAYVWWDDRGRKVKVKHKGCSESDGDLTKPQVNRSVRQYRSALRQKKESGYEIRTEKRSKRWCNG